MAEELSQAEVLDFLCQAGGRVANAALVGHFRGFLRDPGASPEELRRRRELFKGFVNSVATVKVAGPGAPKDVVLRKRYRELVGEGELKAPAAAAAESPGTPPPPPDLPAAAARAPQSRAGLERAPRAPGGACRREAAGPQVEAARRPCRGPEALGPGPRSAPGGRARRCSERGHLRGPEEEDPAGRGELGPAQPGAPWPLRAEEEEDAPPPPPVPVEGATGAPAAGEASPQQRIREWVARHHAALGDQPSSPPGSAWGGHPPPPPPAVPGAPWDPPGPVFRSIRCQLSLQDLEDFLEQESSASDRSSASGGSDSDRGVLGRLLRRPKGRGRKPTGGDWAEGPFPKPPPNGPRAPWSKEGTHHHHQNGTLPEHHTLLSWIAGRAFPSSKPRAKDPERQTKKVAGWLPPNLEAPQSPQLARREGQGAASTPDVKGPSLDVDEPAEPRSALVPLEPREHAWLVKVAAGSWMQARALLLEDPHLATRKDFISGYTVLHWLAKHGNAQVLLDFVTGARKAGVALDMNVRSGCGYTPLHLAAMHGHQVVMKLLVEKFRCHVQIRDSSGKKPWQYLSGATSGEVWQLLGAPRGQTIFPARPIAKICSPPARRGKSPELARKISRKASLAAYLKPQHIKWKMANKCPPLHEREEYSD
uniref:Ankyrin repeat domain-containing protein SOWAHB n=1 Tax=Pogona vitticeps TaxID=103695 RepID=A0A6J0URX4_9SAUR